jgi:hypothetical protein
VQCKLVYCKYSKYEYLYGPKYFGLYGSFSKAKQEKELALQMLKTLLYYIVVTIKQAKIAM